MRWKLIKNFLARCWYLIRFGVGVFYVKYDVRVKREEDDKVYVTTRYSDISIRISGMMADEKRVVDALLNSFNRREIEIYKSDDEYHFVEIRNLCFVPAREILSAMEGNLIERYVGHKRVGKLTWWDRFGV